MMTKTRSKKQDVEKLLESFVGGVIMDVTDAEQAKIAEDAGAVSVMALYKVPSDIRKEGGVARTASLDKIEEVMNAVNIPVMAKVRIGHYGEARMLEELGVDFIDESEVLTPADSYHVDKIQFKTPFVCGARDLGEALRRLTEGAAMIRTKGEAGTGDVNQAVAHMRKIRQGLAELVGVYELGKFYGEQGLENMDHKISERAREYRVPKKLVYEVAKLKKLPVLNYAAGGIATPADAVYMMLLGADGVFVGSGIFKSEDPEKRAKSIVNSVRYWDNPSKLVEVSRGLGEGMKGIATESLEKEEMTQYRGK